MNSANDILELLHRLWGLPGYALVYVSCILFGYLAKATRFVPNDKIPLLLFLWGTIWNLLLADTRSADTSLRLWLARNLLFGFIVAGLAWATHAWVLKARLDPKLFAAPAAPLSPASGEQPKKPNET